MVVRMRLNVRIYVHCMSCSVVLHTLKNSVPFIVHKFEKQDVSVTVQ